MRITIEPTPNRGDRIGPEQHTVIVDDPSDDLIVSHVLELLANMLVCYGYSRENIEASWKLEEQRSEPHGG